MKQVSSPSPDVHDHFYFRNHLCITFELLGMNLYELIKKNNFHGFSLSVVRRIAIALLKCLCSGFVRAAKFFFGPSDPTSVVWCFVALPKPPPQTCSTKSA